MLLNIEIVLVFSRFYNPIYNYYFNKLIRCVVRHNCSAKKRGDFEYAKSPRTGLVYTTSK